MLSSELAVALGDGCPVGTVCNGIHGFGFKTGIVACRGISGILGAMGSDCFCASTTCPAPFADRESSGFFCLCLIAGSGCSVFGELCLSGFWVSGAEYTCDGIEDGAILPFGVRGSAIDGGLNLGCTGEHGIEVWRWGLFGDVR